MTHSANIISLEDIANVRTGYSFRSKIEPASQTEDSILVIQPRDLIYSKLIETPVRIATAEIQSSNKHLLRDGDILLANKGTKFATYCHNEDHGRMVASSSFFIITPEPNIILPEYLQWYLNQDFVKDYLSDKAVGTAIPTINKPTVEGISILVPAISEQIKAVAIIKEIDKENDLMKKLISKRAELRDQFIWNLIQKKHED
jgi:restriction endonuclease S subunit